MPAGVQRHAGELTIENINFSLFLSPSTPSPSLETERTVARETNQIPVTHICCF